MSSKFRTQRAAILRRNRAAGDSVESLAVQRARKSREGVHPRGGVIW